MPDRMNLRHMFSCPTWSLSFHITYCSILNVVLLLVLNTRSPTQTGNRTLGAKQHKHLLWYSPPLPHTFFGVSLLEDQGGKIVRFLDWVTEAAGSISTKVYFIKSINLLRIKLSRGRGRGSI